MLASAGGEAGLPGWAGVVHARSDSCHISQMTHKLVRFSRSRTSEPELTVQSLVLVPPQAWRAWACAGLPWPARCVLHPLPLRLVYLYRLKRSGLDLIYQALRNPLPSRSHPPCASISAWCGLFVPYGDFST